MLDRILEPELMDTPNEATGYDAMDHSTVNCVFVADFLAAWNGRGPILDLGTGTAQIPIEFCRQSEVGKVFAIDAAANMIDLARQNVQKAQLIDRVELQLVDAKRLPYSDRFWPALMSNSIVHHIPQPIDVFREIARVVIPGATILVRDLLRPTDRAALDHLVNTYADDATPHQRKMFAESLHAALTLSEARELVASVGFNPVSVSQTTDRHWTWCVRGN